ncbi:ubiquinone anaerobic biosynthesis accessory factor UbiT [Azospirillum halopraeferens]|uniref:ubiquinone anaerobic biosynthesis accessory factor UbiT n=1 Tax=Azospirillum halopraeferens TaxID=34010 RepID=UPI0004109D52|nr:SCP2 sterol-binding domain-containing protein [Azospirillum halopraeferens]
MPPIPPELAVRRIEAAAAGVAVALAGRTAPALSGRVLDLVVGRVARCHPRAFAALAELPPATLRIEPADRPAAFLLDVGPAVRLRVAGPDDPPPDAAVRGPLADLMDLLEGRIDGDALFFRRTLRIEGDTALVLAVRNAFDGEDMDVVADLAGAFGPLARAVPPARRAAGRALVALEEVRAALLRPLADRVAAVERRLAAFDREGR